MQRTISGLSLIELLLVLAITSILASMAFKQSPTWINQLRADAVLNSLRGGLNIARHTAIISNVDVIVCPRAGSGCGPRNSWHQGTLVFEDHDSDRAYTEGDVVVTQLPPITSGHVEWRAFRSRSYLRFTSRGMTDWQNGHLRYCPYDGDLRQARQVVLNYAGRTYASRDADGDGIHEDVQGAPLACS
jgi:type IV fimbrial biogenesis protein FimT